MLYKNYEKIILFICLSAVAREEYDKVVPLPIGNLALPTSQQPSPLFCFGQNIVDKGDLQAFVYAEDIKLQNTHFTGMIPNIFYGITDDLSLLAGVQIGRSKICNQSHSFADLLVQFEYAFYNNDQLTCGDQATVVTNILIPTSSKVINPAIGFTAPSAFIGCTASHMSQKWYYFISPGIIFPLPQHDQRFGNQYLYQAGIARNLYYVPNKRVLTLMVEFFGQYNQKDKIHHKKDPNSGGNFFYIGPSLWFATDRFLLDVGVSFAVIEPQSQKGPHNYFVALEFGYKFNN